MPSDANDRSPASAGAGDESFLRRWSRRKQQSTEGQRPQTAEPETTDTPDAPPAGEPAPQPSEPAAGPETPAEADLPDPSTLPPDSDFSAYLSGRVSSHLKRAAMRRMFSSPEFNVRDGLDDYDEDYTQFQSLGDTVTAHMRHHQERLRKRDEEAAERAESEAREARDAADETESAEPPEHTADAANDETDTDHSRERDAGRDDPLDDHDTT